ncbi:MAG: glycine betaine ABC transporter substrate-binding protein [Nocardioidaceae bacterium]
MKISNVMRSAGVMATLVASAVALAACGGGDGAATASDDSVASTVDLNGVKISVGSKEYPEQLILGQITVQALEGAGATVTDKTGLSGTNVARAALEKGETDVYWEYTGTAWTTFFKETKTIDDPQQFFEAVRAADEKNDISWFALAPFNNTYAVGATAEAAEATGVTSISEYAELAATNPEDAMLCASSEFSTRDDGLPGLEKLYGFDATAGVRLPCRVRPSCMKPPPRGVRLLEPRQHRLADRGGRHRRPRRRQVVLPHLQPRCQHA